MNQDEAGDLERWMNLGETRPAAGAAQRLEAELRRTGRNGIGFKRLRGAFVALLDRRGYLVDTPESLSGAVAEIRDVGAGFDLYDLSEALAALDAAAGARHFPELRPFVPCKGGKT